MDIYCPTCREPWDNDCLHEEADARQERKAENEAQGAVFTLGTTYSEVAADFRKRGCKALIVAYGPQRSCVADDAGKSETISVIYTLMGDDMDGAASFLDDASALGLLD